jgi:murein DD-endopeptidase MepM/ murein hydrolase activator NlpD
MKLSNDTLAILKNFAAIQPNLMFRAGNEIKTIAEAKNIVAKATITESIPQDFGIYDINDFLSSLSLFSTPEFNVSDDAKFAKISEGKSNLKYFFSDESSLTYPQKDINMPATDVAFTLTADVLKNLQRATALLGVSTVSVESGENGIILRVNDPKNSTSNAYATEVDGVTGGHTFKFHYDISNFKLLPGDYLVSISGKLISHFKHKTIPVEYWIALEKSSTYEA